MIQAAGSILLQHVVPRGVSDESLHNLDSGKIDRLVEEIVREDPEHAHTVVGQLGKLFFDYATENGFSIGLEDYENDTQERHAMIDQFERDVEKVMSSSLDRRHKNHKISELAENLQKTLGKHNLNHLLSKRKTSALMAATGARGNPGQLMQASASPVLGSDSQGQPVPLPIKHSYAEGLSLGEMAAMSFGARHNTLKAQLSTSEPGAIFKYMAPNVIHEVISEHDCGTRDGVVYPLTEEKSLLYRFESGSNKLLDPGRLRELEREGRKTVKVRTPLTCHAHEGICQLCYGYTSEKKLPPIGTNVGVQSSQAVSETLTQSILSTKHTGGLAGKSRDAYAVSNNFLKNPKNFLDEATLSEIPGEVREVYETPLGDHVVNVEGKEHFVPNVQEVIVKPGDHVGKGKPVSTGMVNPRTLAQLRGLETARRYYSKTLRDLYNGSPEKSQKMRSLDPRHFDVIARNMVKYVRVDDPGDTHLLPGAEVAVDKLAKILHGESHEVPTSKALGKVYALTGETVTPEMVEDMLEHGKEEIPVVDNGLKVTPLVKGLLTNKLADPNWISRLSFRDISRQLREAASRGDESELHSYDPTLPYVYGKEFGLGSGGKY